MIFALLGIASDTRQLPFKPDYEDSIETVFIKVTTFLLSTDQWFQILTMAGPSSRSSRMNHLPSWVPDYEFYVPTSTSYHLNDKFQSNTKVQSRDKAARVTFLPGNPARIQIQAVTFDMVKILVPELLIKRYPLPPNFHSPAEISGAHVSQYLSNSVAEMREWYQACLEVCRNLSAPLHTSDEQVFQSYWELCMSGGESFSEDMERKMAPLYLASTVEARKLFEAFVLTDPDNYLEKLDRALESSLGLTGKDTQAILKTFDFLQRKFVLTVLGKAFCITAAGSMALVPAHAKTGDMLVHVRGGLMASVLREKDPTKKMAIWIGTASVDSVKEVYPGLTWEHWFLE